MRAVSDAALQPLVRHFLTFDQEDSRAMSDVLFWFPAMALQPGEQLSCNPATDFILRLLQFRIAVASSQTDEALLLMDQALELLKRFDHKGYAQSSELLAYRMFLSTINVPIPPRRSINMLFRLMELEESDEHLAEVAKWFRADDIPNTDFPTPAPLALFPICLYPCP